MRATWILLFLLGHGPPGCPVWNAHGGAQRAVREPANLGQHYLSGPLAPKLDGEALCWIVGYMARRPLFELESTYYALRQSNTVYGVALLLDPVHFQVTTLTNMPFRVPGDRPPALGEVVEVTQYLAIQPAWPKPGDQRVIKQIVRHRGIERLRLELYFRQDTHVLVWKAAIKEEMGGHYGSGVGHLADDCVRQGATWAFAAVGGGSAADADEQGLARDIIRYFSLSDLPGVFSEEEQAKNSEVLRDWALKQPGVSYCDGVSDILRRLLAGMQSPHFAAQARERAELFYRATGRSSLAFWNHSSEQSKRGAEEVFRPFLEGGRFF